MASTIASQGEAAKARLPLAYRDQCSALVLSGINIVKPSLTDWPRLLIPLNKCRRQGNYMQWNCEHESKLNYNLPRTQLNTFRPLASNETALKDQEGTGYGRGRVSQVTRPIGDVIIYTIVNNRHYC
ncbi:NADH-ubiquinone oxidoreductase b18 subunit (NDUFB7) domain-containing protein [Rhizoctonia solani AG-1 IA]|uniref:NADH-ubiquinone oxidoreductase b18 subunit (NDUFB7) domain-containing protein n=1 Tax=Thanatephorus cucumeris (strain AG1-IA) TaxID=983506 RepID=L8WLT9_THACA|nr:NADH-ubiquinone oxidoreductase b18 subunit (NDUFB7) domain-containing protein [Rhizoctonia solani AG-1 IA]